MIIQFIVLFQILNNILQIDLLLEKRIINKRSYYKLKGKRKFKFSVNWN